MTRSWRMNNSTRYCKRLEEHIKNGEEQEKTLKELNEFKSQCAILIEKVNTITALVFELENRNKIDKLGEQDDEAAK